MVTQTKVDLCKFGSRCSGLHMRGEGCGEITQMRGMSDV